MKTSLIAAISLLSVSAFANDNYVINLNWSDKSTLSDNVVQMCDDSYYPAVELVVPGKAGKDFVVEMSADITKGKASFGCTFKANVGESSTTYTFDAVDGNCFINMYKIRVDLMDKNQTATYEIHDAC